MFSSLFHSPDLACASQLPSATPAFDSLSSPVAAAQPASTQPNSTQPVSAEIDFPQRSLFLPTQARWLADPSPLRIWEKSRQVGATFTDALDSVFKASHGEARFDVWVSSRDELQSSLYLDDCKTWARILNLAALDLGRVFLDRKNSLSARVLEFANGRRVYSLSSNPNAFAGKRGHVKIDEFALHADQRNLYKIAKPVTQWGGTLSIISTHRGPGTLFNQLIREIRRNPGDSPWHLYSYPIQQAIAEGLVERINEKSGRNETRDQFAARIRAECIDEDQWNQEYCCIPSDETSVFITHDMITACEDPAVKLLSLDQLSTWLNSPDAPADPRLYLGVDVGRKRDLCVLDLGLEQNGILEDKLRLELSGQPFPVIEAQLYRLLALPQLCHACIDETGIGMELAERAHLAFGPKVEPVCITAPMKEKLAFGLRNAFESKTLRLPVDPKLRADIHAMKKHFTASSRVRFDGHTDDSHCDRFMAKALRQHAARPLDEQPWALLC